jgi:hypothetical protein
VDGVILKPDSRNRVSLNKIAKPDVEYYIATSDDSGIITLTPAVAVPARMVNA